MTTSRTRVPIIAGVLVVLAGGFFLLREPEPIAPDDGEQEEDVQPAAAPPTPTPVAKQPEATPAPTPAAAAETPPMPPEDFFSGELDDALADAHARLLDGKYFSIPMMKRLAAHREENPKDGRANLLLAYDAMQRGAEGHAVRLYRMAWQNNPDIRRDPKVLTDLVDILATHDGAEYTEGTEAIEMIFGADAIPAIDARLETARQESRPKRVERLEKLKAHLR